MIRQYYPQRFRQNHPCGRPVGTITVGTIAYIQDRLGRFDRPVCRNPWIVEAWLPREYAVCGGPNTFCRGGHLAVVRSLRDGRRQLVADHYLLCADDLGLTY